MDFKGILRQNLTEEQFSAVLDEKPEILCLACAGSGKSRTLAFRIAYLVAKGCPANSIVAFTFTEKAAESIKRRVSEALLKFNLSQTLVGAMYIGTIHSYCKYLLGNVNAKYRQFEVLDENGMKLYLLSRYYSLGLNEIKKERKSKMFETIREVSNAWSTANDEAINYDAIIVEDETLGKLLKTIDSKLETDQFIDFSLLIRRAVEVLENNSPSINQALSSVQHIFVDEYQDINPMQEHLIQQLHKRSDSLMVVGDDDQSIYAWRGADVSKILNFKQQYPKCTTHILNINFRSTTAIVKISDEFIQQVLSTERYTKNPSAFRDDKIQDFKSFWFSTREDEADGVAKKIKCLLGTKYTEYNADGTIKEERGLTYADFAILFRSIKRNFNRNNLHHRHHEVINALRSLYIPYTLEAEGGIFERPHAKIIRNTMELLRYPAPKREDIQELFDNEILSCFPKADFNKLSRVISNWNLLIHAPAGGARRKVYPQELLHQILNAFRVGESHFDDVILRDLGVFSKIILDVEKVYVSIDSSKRYSEILNFLSNVAETGYDIGTMDIVTKPNAVTISTVHKMKGLEYPVVFIVDVVDQRFPSRKSDYSGWLPKALMTEPISRGAYCTTRQDEARLFYTAMTRAERFLYITGAAQQPDTQRLKKPSDFKLRIDSLGVSSNQSLPNCIEYIDQKRRIDETVIPTSFSDIKEYLTCPMGYKLKKMFKFNPAVPELFGFGLTVHSIIERLHQQYPTTAPSLQEIENLVEETFHLKHIFPSGDPKQSPGPYENAYESAVKIAKTYVNSFSQDFERIREDEARFEINIGQALVSGSIDLLLKRDDLGNIVESQVIDFKSMELPDKKNSNDWITLSLQVQLYAHAADNVLGEKTRTGSVHLLKEQGSNARVNVPVTEEAISSAIKNISWAVDRILGNDFPMRPCLEKCNNCDVKRLCPKKPQAFLSENVPPPIHVPLGHDKVYIKAFSEFEG